MKEWKYIYGDGVFLGVVCWEWCSYRRLLIQMIQRSKWFKLFRKTTKERARLYGEKLMS